MKTPKEANDMLLESMIEEVRKQKRILKLREELQKLENLLIDIPESESQEIVEKIDEKVREINALKEISEIDIAESKKRVYDRVFGSTTKQKKRIPKKIFRSIIIASILVVAFTASVTAARLGLFEGIENIRDLFFKRESTKIEKDGYDIVVTFGEKTYTTVDEMLKAEKVDMLYLKTLPKGCNLEIISVNEYDYRQYTFKYNNGIIFRVNDSGEDLTAENPYILDYEVTVELCFTDEDDTYTAYWKYEGLNYELSCKSKEEIIFILDNMFTK